jgi:hypothetical protein
MSDGKKEKKRKRGKYLTQSEAEEQERRDREFIEQVSSGEERKAVLGIRGVNSEDPGFKTNIKANFKEWEARLTPAQREARRIHDLEIEAQEKEWEARRKAKARRLPDKSDDESDYEDLERGSDDSSGSEFEDDEWKPFSQYVPPSPPKEKEKEKEKESGTVGEEYPIVDDPDPYSDSEDIDIDISKKRKREPTPPPPTPPTPSSESDASVQPTKKPKVHVVISDDDDGDEVEIVKEKEAPKELGLGHLVRQERNRVLGETEKLRKEYSELINAYNEAKERKKAYKARYPTPESRSNNALYETRLATLHGTKSLLRRRRDEKGREIDKRDAYLKTLYPK